MKVQFENPVRIRCPPLSKTGVTARHAQFQFSTIVRLFYFIRMFSFSILVDPVIVPPQLKQEKHLVSRSIEYLFLCKAKRKPLHQYTPAVHYSIFCLTGPALNGPASWRRVPDLAIEEPSILQLFQKKLMDRPNQSYYTLFHF